MECVKDIEAFNTYIRKNRVYTFLDGLDDRLDHMRAEVLKLNLFPTIEQAYGHVRRENIRQGVMIKEDGGYQNLMAMASKGFKSAEVKFTVHRNNIVDKSKLKCSHCGGTRHVKEQCFQIVGYPEWYIKRKNNNKQQISKGKTAIATTITELGRHAQTQMNQVSSLVSTQQNQLKLVHPGDKVPGLEENCWVRVNQEQEPVGHETG
jgi:hypothetical protein